MPGVIERWLFGTEPGRRVLVVHAGLAAIVGLRVALGPYRQYAGQPPAFFRPVWFLQMLPSMPPLGAIVALQVAGVVAAVAAIAGSRCRRRRGRQAAFVLAWACLLVLAGLRASQGKVLHNDVTLLLACVPFLAFDPRKADQGGWALRTAMVVVAGAYFFAGYHKVVASGLDWVTTDNVRNIMIVGSRSGRVMFPEVAEFVARQGGLLHVVAAATLALELTFPVVLAWRRARLPYALAAFGLHAGTWLVLGIDYWVWAAVTLVVLVEGKMWASGRRRRRDPGRPVRAGDGPPVRWASAGTPAGPAPS